jgi:hypothetical protein
MSCGRCLLLCAVMFVLSACASDPPPEPIPLATDLPEKSAEPPAPPPKNVQKQAASNPCRGLVQTSCVKLKGCEWVKNEKPTNKEGQAHFDYCRLKVASTAKK